MVLELLSEWEFLSPEERRQAVDLVGRETKLGLKTDPQNAPLLISSILFVLTTDDPSKVAPTLEPMLITLQEIAPNRLETHQLLAIQALLRGSYSEAFNIAEAYEARAPGTEPFFVEIKQSAQEGMSLGVK